MPENVNLERRPKTEDPTLAAATPRPNKTKQVAGPKRCLCQVLPPDQALIQEGGESKAWPKLSNLLAISACDAHAPPLTP